MKISIFWKFKLSVRFYLKFWLFLTELEHLMKTSFIGMIDY